MWLTVLAYPYQRYESGESEPSFQTLDALASCLNVSVDYLLSRTNDSSPSIESIEFIDEDYGIIDLYGLDREDIRAVAHIVDALKRRQAK